jgi:flagellar hook-associated protein 2
MMKTSIFSTNSFWHTQYTPSVVNNIKSLNSQQNQLLYSFQSLKTLSNLSVKNFQSQQSQYRNTVTNFTDSASGVSSSVKTLMASDFFNQKYVSTSTADVAVTGEAKTGATTAQYSVGVSQVAAAQQNEGKTLVGGAYGGVPAGNSTLGIKVGNGLEQQVSVTVLATDNNGQVLAKFANAINSSGAGVQAEVKTKNNFKYVSITTKDTGAANSFTIRDISGSGVSALQLDNKVINAADAQYTVDGTSYQSATNTVSLDHEHVSLQLNAITTGAIKVNVGEDDSKIVDAVQALVTNYNNLEDVFGSSDKVTQQGASVLNRVESLVGKTRVTDFAAIGISLNQYTGALELDQQKLSAALESSPDKVKSLLVGAASLGQMVDSVSKDIASTPVSSYFKPPSPLDVLNYGSQYSSSGWKSLQNNNFIQGLFLNMTA